MSTNPPSEVELVLVVAASFFLLEPRDLDIPGVVLMTQSDLYSCVVDGGQDELKQIITSQVFSCAILSFPATESKFSEYKTFLVSQGITEIQRMSWDKLMGFLKNKSHESPRSHNSKKEFCMDELVNGLLAVEAPPSDATLKELIKFYWEETGGDTSQIFDKISATGRKTTKVSVMTAKSHLLRKDKWVPPGGLLAVNSVQRTLQQVSKTANPSQVVPTSNSELIRQGAKMVGDGLAMIQQGLTGMEAFQEKIKELAPLLDALKG